MAIKRPTREQLSDIAAGFGFHVDSRQLAEYDDALQANFDAYDVIDALPDHLPTVSYPRTPATARKATRTVTAHGRARARSTAPPTVSCAAGRWPSKTTSASPVCRCATAQARSRATCPISMRPSSRGCSTPARRSPARRPASTTAFRRLAHERVGAGAQSAQGRTLGRRLVVRLWRWSRAARSTWRSAAGGR